MSNFESWISQTHKKNWIKDKTEVKISLLVLYFSAAKLLAKLSKLTLDTIVKAARGRGPVYLWRN